MPKKSFEEIVQGGVRFLSRFFPQSRYLYFPLLSAALTWIIASREEWKENIFSWEVWLDPHFVKNKPDEFILNFFTEHPGLSRMFSEEIRCRDLPSLREHFYSLYPVLGLDDPFLAGLFHEDLENKDYRAIVREYDQRVSQAVVDIEALNESDRFLDGLKAIAEEMASLGAGMITQTSVQNALADIIKKELNRDKE